MITAKDMNIWVGNRELLHSLNFTVNPLQRVALTGANGAGKTTLLNTFKLTPEARKLQFSESLTIDPVRMAWVEQEVPNTSELALDYVINGDLVYQQAMQDLERGMATNDASLIALANVRLDDIDAWTIRMRAAVILEGLGFSQEQQTMPVNQLSGGWRIRLNLARALLVPSDLLLLDEPTNHLDIDAIFWLEDYLLKRYKGTIVFISHDQDFMDNLATHVLHIENGTINSYTGNYSSFVEQRQQKLEVQEKQYRNQQKHIANVQKFIERFRYKANKARQAQSRVKYLEKLQRIDPVVTGSPFSFSFAQAARLPSIIATIRKANIGYVSGKPVLQNVNFSLQPGMRFGLLGLNGAGKSTLIKAFAGELQALDGVGTIQINELVNLGYFNQYVVDKLDLQATPIELLMRLDSKLLVSEARNFLAGFNFTGDKVFEKIDSFSGGEKSRLALALIVYQRPNLLLLDEPTNHLDLEMRQALATALQEFTGSLIVVSHDRFLLSSVVEDFYLINDGKIEEFTGDLNDYHQWVIQYKAEKEKQRLTQVSAVTSSLADGTLKANNELKGSFSPTIATIEGAATTTINNHNLQPNNLALAEANETADLANNTVKIDTRLARELNRLTLKQTQEQKRLSKRIDVIQEELKAIEQSYLDPQISTDGQKVQELTVRTNQLRSELATLEEQWFELEMEKEEITANFMEQHRK